jgi:hypothetical protein
MISLDDIDPDFISVILDILEHYELYKMCLMLCNRYSLHERVAKYFVQIAYKYSNISQLSLHDDTNLIANQDIISGIKLDSIRNNLKI